MRAAGMSVPTPLLMTLLLRERNVKESKLSLIFATSALASIAGIRTGRRSSMYTA